MKNGQSFKIILAMMMIVALIVSGCSKKGVSNEASSENGENKMSITFFVDAGGTTVLPEENDFVKEAIEKKFNVHLKMEYMTYDQTRADQLNVRLAGGDVPDVFTSDGISTSKYAMDGMLADLGEYVSPETMPNYFKWVTETELERYRLNNKVVRLPIPFARDIYRAYYVRKDWLDNLGLDVPTNYEEMMDVMKAFTFDDPDGNGKKDTYGFSASGDGKMISLDFPQWVHHGLIGASLIENNKLIDVQTDPRVENVVDDIAKMIDEGLVDPDWFLHSGLKHYDQAARGKVGIVLANANAKSFAMESVPDSVLNQSRAINPEADWVPFNPFPEGRWTEALPGYPVTMPKSIEKEPEKIKKALEILDFLASEEGFLLTHYGLEGEHYTKEGNTVTLKPEQIQKDIVEKGNFLDVYDFFTPDEPQVLGLNVIDPRISDHDVKILEEITSYKNIPSIGTNIVPPEGANLGDLRGKQYEYHAKMLFEEKSGKNWSKYRQDLMENYQGNLIFGEYEKQIKAAGVIK